MRHTTIFSSATLLAAVLAGLSAAPTWAASNQPTSQSCWQATIQYQCPGGSHYNAVSYVGNSQSACATATNGAAQMQAQAALQKFCPGAQITVKVNRPCVSICVGRSMPKPTAGNSGTHN